VEFEEKTEDMQQDMEATASSISEDSKFVPVPIPLSNPTIGSGLLLGLIYLHEKETADADAPASMSGLGAFYTDSDSWGAGVFHSGSYFRDTLRLSGGVFYGELNLKFYGIGEDSSLRDRPLDYSAKATVFAPKGTFELPWNNWFGGIQYVFAHMEARFDLSSLLPILPAINETTSTAGLGPVLIYDGRDNNLWPLDGTYFETSVLHYGKYLGGDFTYQKYKAKFAQFFPLTESLSVAYRLDGQFMGGDPPFYDLSQPKLHGIPGGRYADKHAVAMQIEPRWRFHERWYGLIFGGVGRIGEEVSDLADNSSIYAGGAGVRYVINREQRLTIGIDVTYSDDETEFYIMVGDIMTR